MKGKGLTGRSWIKREQKRAEKKVAGEGRDV